jgi:hypothetical protein
VGDRFDGTPATDWTNRLTETAGGGTRLVQEFQHRPDGLSGLRSQAEADPDRAAQLVADRAAVLLRNMQKTLARIGSAVEGEADSGG